jgi:serralysin
MPRQFAEAGPEISFETMPGCACALCCDAASDPATDFGSDFGSAAAALSSGWLGQTAFAKAGAQVLSPMTAEGGPTFTPGSLTDATILETGDATGGTDTPYAMAPGDYFYGTIDATDADWVAVTLTAGQTYTMAMIGVGALELDVDDTYLRLRDSTGALLVEDDDGGPGATSLLSYTPATTGTYYLDAQSFGSSAGGGYGLAVTEGTKVSLDTEMGAAILYRPDASWSGSAGSGASVTWGVRATGNAPSGGQTLEILTAAQIAATEGAMALFDGLSGLSFTRVNDTGTTNSATMLFGGYTSSTDGAGAYAYYPGSTSSTSNSGDVWLNNQYVSGTSLPAGSYSNFVLLHEIGHAVGLAHPGDYNAAPGVSITYANNAQFREDSHQYTVMSYFDENNTTTSFGSYPDTLLLFDIKALHALYGADTSFHAGNSVYGFNSNLGGVYDFATNTRPVMSLYDGGGTDTIDLSGYTAGQVLSLVEGAFSDIGGYLGNLSIAFGAVIENAIGGSGADSLTGNAAANTLSGGAGADTLSGGDGADKLDGGTGNDILAGGLGNDRYVVDSAGDTITGEIGFSLGGGIDTVESFLDWTLGTNLEVLRLQGSANLNGYGNAAPESLVGNPGANTLDGGGGNDILNAKAGDDTLIGGTGRDTMVGDGGSDTFVYTSFADSYAGPATRDFLNGFTHGEDRIDLSAIDANPFNSGDQAFQFIGNAAFTGAGSNSAGELRTFTFGGGNFNIVQADWNGDGTPEMEIFVNLTDTMSASDFIL